MPTMGMNIRAKASGQGPGGGSETPGKRDIDEKSRRELVDSANDRQTNCPEPKMSRYPRHSGCGANGRRDSLRQVSGR